MNRLPKLLLLAALTALVATASCLDKPCDSNQLYQDNLCIPDPRLNQAGAAGTGGASVGALAGAPATAFGQVCTGNGDCSAPAPYCALQPGKTTGYCSVEGCKATPGLCPSGWSCAAYTTAGFCLAPS